MFLGRVFRSSMRCCGNGCATYPVGTPSSQSLPTLHSNRMYHKRVLDHYNNPRNVGSLDKTQSNVGTGLVGAPACGDVMKLQIEVDPKTDIIIKTRFKTFGCGSAIASSSYGSELIIGKTLHECTQVTNTEISKHLSLPPVKLHCSALMQDAIRAAVSDYQDKQT